MNRAVDYAAYDRVVVERLVAGDHPGEPLRPADAGEATRQLVRRGFDDGQIAARLGYTRRHVLRIRQLLGIPPALPRNTGNGHTRLVAAPHRPRSEG